MFYYVLEAMLRKQMKKLLLSLIFCPIILCDLLVYLM